MITYPPPTHTNGTHSKPDETRPNPEAVSMLYRMIVAFAIRNGHLPQIGATT